MTNSSDNLDSNISAIDLAIQKAQARKAAKLAAQSANGERVHVLATSEDACEEKSVRSVKQNANEQVLRESERTERKLLRSHAREELLAARDVARRQRLEVRAAKKATRLAEQTDKKAHMSKVQKAAERLPALENDAAIIVNEITTNFSAVQITAIALHLQHFNRVYATEHALNVKLEVGQAVTIVGGDPRFIGRVGTISRVQRIRAFVNVEELGREVYIFTSDCKVIVPEEVEPSDQNEEFTGTEG